MQALKPFMTLKKSLLLKLKDIRQISGYLEKVKNKFGVENAYRDKPQTSGDECNYVAKKKQPL